MRLIITLSILLLPTIICGQIKNLDTANSTITVSGTSTLHDWTIKAEKFSSSTNIILKDDVMMIDHLTVKIKVEGLKSGKNVMDKNTYKAMNSDEYPEIKYELIKVENILKTTQGYLLDTKGKLLIAGVNRDCDLQVQALKKNGLAFSGSIKFNMTDYNIDPPTALLGTIKTGDEVEIIFNVKYN